MSSCKIDHFVKLNIGKEKFPDEDIFRMSLVTFRLLILSITNKSSVKFPHNNKPPVLPWNDWLLVISKGLGYDFCIVNFVTVQPIVKLSCKQYDLRFLRNKNKNPCTHVYIYIGIRPEKKILPSLTV